jgi:hypothetical protein
VSEVRALQYVSDNLVAVDSGLSRGVPFSDLERLREYARQVADAADERQRARPGAGTLTTLLLSVGLGYVPLLTAPQPGWVPTLMVAFLSIGFASLAHDLRGHRDLEQDFSLPRQLANELETLAADRPRAKPAGRS